MCVVATRVRAAHHEPDDVPQPPGGGGPAEPPAGTLLLGVCAPLSAPHPTLQVPGTCQPFSWESVLLSLPRIQHSRYQVRVNCSPGSLCSSLCPATNTPGTRYVSTVLLGVCAPISAPQPTLQVPGTCQLFSWESVLLSLPRIQHSRYQVRVNRSPGSLLLSLTHIQHSRYQVRVNHSPGSSCSYLCQVPDTCFLVRDDLFLHGILPFAYPVQDISCSGHILFRTYPIQDIAAPFFFLFKINVFPQLFYLPLSPFQRGL